MHFDRQAVKRTGIVCASVLKNLNPLQENQSSSLFNLSIDAQGGATLKSAASWGRVLAITGIVIGVLMLIIGFVAQYTISNFEVDPQFNDMYKERTAKTAGNMALVVYVIGGVIMIISSMLVLNFSNRVINALRNMDQSLLNRSFNALKSLLILWAILGIIILLSVFVTFVGMVGFSATE